MIPSAVNSDSKERLRSQPLMKDLDIIHKFPTREIGQFRAWRLESVNAFVEILVLHQVNHVTRSRLP